jgi:hypothetical protein
MPNGDLYTLEAAASEIADYIPVSKSAAPTAYGFDWMTLITTLLVPLITDILANCNRSADSVVEMARSGRVGVRDLVYRTAHAKVSGTYSLLGRLFYSRRISRTANDLTDATLAASVDLTNERAGALMAAAKATKGRQAT